MDDARRGLSRRRRRTVLNEMEEIVLMEKYFSYLERLRHSGVTNMYGARPYLQQEFPELANDPKRASEILKVWMNSYQTKGGAGE